MKDIKAAVRETHPEALSTPAGDLLHHPAQGGDLAVGLGGVGREHRLHQFIRRNRRRPGLAHGNPGGQLGELDGGFNRRPRRKTQTNRRQRCVSRAGSVENFARRRAEVPNRVASEA